MNGQGQVASLSGFSIALLFYFFSTTPTYGVKVVGGLVQECVERLQDLEAVLAGRGGAEGEGAGEEVVLHVDHEEGGALCNNKIGVRVRVLSLMKTLEKVSLVLYNTRNEL